MTDTDFLSPHPHDERQLYKQRHHDAIGGIFLIFLGVVFILINTQVLPQAVWHYFVGYWPLILILLGVDMFLRTSLIGRFISTLVALMAATYLILSALYIYHPSTYTQVQKQFPWLPRSLPLQRQQHDRPPSNIYFTPEGGKLFQN